MENIKSVAVEEASKHFHDLLARVEKGEVVAIIRGSTHVATLTPAASPKGDLEALRERVLSRRRSVMESGGGLSIEQIKHATRDAVEHSL